MGQRKPQKREYSDILRRAQQFVDADPDPRFPLRAVEAVVMRTDAGSVAIPVTWKVRIEFPVGVDPSFFWVTVDDESGEVRNDPLHLL